MSLTGNTNEEVVEEESIDEEIIEESIDEVTEEVPCEDVDTIMETVEQLETSKSTGERKPSKKKKTIVSVLFISFIVGVFIYTILSDFFGTNREEVSHSITAVRRIFSNNWGWLILAVLAVVLSFFFSSLAYATKMHAFSGKMHYKTCVNGMMIGAFYGTMTPLGLGGKPFQMHYFRQVGVPSGATIAIPVANYALRMFVIVILSIAALIIFTLGVFDSPYISIDFYIIVLALIGVLVNIGIPTLLIVSLISQRASRGLTKTAVIIAKKLRLTKDPARLYYKILKKLRAARKALGVLVKQKRLLLIFALMLAAKISAASVGYFVIKAFGFNAAHGLGFIEIVAVCILISSAISFFPTPGGSGAAELTFFFVFSTALMRSTGIASGSIATLTWRLIGFYMMLIVSAIWVIVLANRSKKKLTVIKNLN